MHYTLFGCKINSYTEFFYTAWEKPVPQGRVWSKNTVCAGCKEEKSVNCRDGNPCGASLQKRLGAGRTVGKAETGLHPRRRFSVAPAQVPPEPKAACATRVFFSQDVNQPVSGQGSGRREGQVEAVFAAQQQVPMGSSCQGTG